MSNRSDERHYNEGYPSPRPEAEQQGAKMSALEGVDHPNELSDRGTVTGVLNRRAAALLAVGVLC
ncbi:MAG TPA: hypothetical protein VEZ90_10275 [Blastocatellia bacterium]|nr:hypothetical protein [Blastocatellia bacterium]